MLVRSVYLVGENSSNCTLIIKSFLEKNNLTFVVLSIYTHTHSSGKINLFNEKMKKMSFLKKKENVNMKGNEL